MRAVILNLWVVNPLESKHLSPRGHPGPSENTDAYIVIYNSSKITVMR